MTRYLSFLLLAGLMAGCNTVPSIPRDYGGADRGAVLVGLGATDTDFQSWSLLFQRRNDATHAIGEFYYQKRGLLGRLLGSGRAVEPDYVREDDPRGDEHGVVMAASLPPGAYEIHGVREHFNGGQIQIDYRSTETFAVPFTVVSGRTVYLGNYQATSFRGRNFIGIPVTVGAYYAVEDRRDEDVAIGVRKGLVPADTIVVDATPAAPTLSGITLVSPEERDRRRARE